MSEIIFSKVRLFLMAVFAVFLLCPLNVVAAEIEQPPTEETAPVEEDEPVAGEEVDPSGDEESAVDEGVPSTTEDENASLEEDKVTEPVGEESDEEQSAGDQMGEEKTVGDEEGDGETASVDTSAAEEIGADGEEVRSELTEEPTIEEEEGVESELSGEGTTDGEENETGDETGSPEEEAQSMVEIVMEMADANAMLVDETGEAISMASEEAGMLLAENSELLENVVLPMAITVIAQDDSNTVYGFAVDEMGQSFTVVNSGLLTKIEIASNTAGASTLKIYLGDASTGVPVIHTQGVVLTDTVTTSGTSVTGYTYQTLTLSTALSVTAGQQYSFGLTNWEAAWFDTSLPGAYTGGRMMTYDGGFWTPYGADDLTFRVHVEEPDPQVPSSPGNTGSGNTGSGNEKGGGQLRADFIYSPEDYALIPGNYVIGGIGWFTDETGYVSFTLPSGVSPDRVKIIFWEQNQYWEILPDTIIIDGVIQGLSMGPGTYIMVY